MAELQFLWGDSRPRPDSRSFVPRSTRWWKQYSEAISVTPEGRAELFRTSSLIASLLPDPMHWNEASRPSRGLVVGAVQSGKTSSMLGVSAIAFDQGYRIVVILSGSKDDLRRQTARRANVQLMRQRDDVSGVTGAYTLPTHVPNRPSGGIALPYAFDIHNWPHAYLKLRHSLESSEPALFVIKKHQASLGEMRAHLERARSEFGREELPTLILDDECDDASVDRAGMPIPEAIANLWRSEIPLPVAYVGYTATAAANLLQDPRNELYPENFVSLLRYPSADDGALTFREPDPEKWYSGGQCFYGAFGEVPGPEGNFLVEASVSQGDLSGSVRANLSLREALRAYIVSGAYRLALQPNVSFSDAARLPAPHSMLVQTSASMDEHERWVSGILEVFGGHRDSSGEHRLDPSGVQSDLEANSEAWERWYHRFQDTRERLYLERPPLGPMSFATWQAVRDSIRLVVENVRVKAVNSDPAVGQSLDYAARLMANGVVAPPQDNYVIAIGGAKLSRGITVEGLCITYFTRWNPNPTDDTVLQISRWFGYRGSYLPFCRLFTTMEIYEALQEIQDNDLDLRQTLGRLMEATLVRVAMESKATCPPRWRRDLFPCQP